MAIDFSTAKNFEFKDMVSRWAGYVSSFDKTNLPLNVAVKGSQNVYKKLSGNWAVRPGQRRRGEANSTLSKVSSSFVWNTSWGSTYTLAVSNSTLYVIADDIWYTLQTSLTKTRYVFDNWWNNSLKKDQLLFVNGTDDMFMWNGGFGLISSTTASTIVLDRTITASFITAASGSVVVNGTTYAYTGSAGSTLTGVTPNPTGEANGSGVLQVVTTSTNTPAADFLTDFIKVINNQVYCGSYTSRLLYISSNTDYTNYTVPSPTVSGSPELVTLDGTCNGIGVRQGTAYVSFGNGSWASIGFSDITVGSTLTRKTTVDVKPVAQGQAAYAHEFIATVGDNIVYLAKDQQIRYIGSANTSFATVYPSLSQEIATELSEETFTGGTLTSIGEFIYVCAPNSGKVYIRQERTRLSDEGIVVAERLWHTPFIWNLTKVDDLDGTTIGFSNANPQIYDLWGTEQYYDDSPFDEELPYECVLALSYRGGERRQGLWSFDKIFTEGYIAQGTPLLLTINYNYQGTESILSQYVNSIEYPAELFLSNPYSLGDESLGEESLGTGGTTSESDTFSKFKNINQFSLVNCFEFQPVLSSNEVNANWELLALGSNVGVEKEQQPTFIIQQQ